MESFPSISARFLLVWLAEIAAKWVLGTLIGFITVRVHGDPGVGEPINLNNDGGDRR